MVEALKVKSIAYRQRWGEAAEPLKLVERSKILIENLQIRDLIRQLDDDARGAVRERLNALYADHSERGLIRSGATLRDGIVVFEEETGSLIANLLREVLPLSRSAGAFALVLEGVEQFLALLDGELVRIVKKVEYENQDSGSIHGIARAAQNLWAEKRRVLLEGLERHRWEFLVPAQDVPEDEPAAELADEGVAAAPEENVEGDDGAELEAVPTPKHVASMGAVVVGAHPEAEENEEEPPMEDRDVTGAAPEDRTPDLAAHWHEMWADTAMRLWIGTLRPRTQPDLVREMADWFDRQGIVPAEGETAECARRLWTKFAATQRVTSNVVRSISEQPQVFASSRVDWPEKGPDAAACRLDPALRDAAHGESATVIVAGAGRAIDLTAPELAFD